MATQYRNLATYALASTAVFLLIWMLLEQETISKCDKVLTQNTRAGELNYENMHLLSNMIVSKVSRDFIKERNGTKHDKWDYNWDKMAPQKGELVPTERRTLVLVRHGQYDFATGKLTELGRHQANLTGLRLKLTGFQYYQIIHSSMERAQETASIIHTHMPGLRISEDDMIREGGPNKPSPVITYWGLPDRDYHTDGPRLEAAFRKYFYRADPSQSQSTVDILVAHGNIFRYFVLRALQLESSAWMRVFIAHASITVLECNADSSVTMTKFGDSGHIPAHMVSY